MAKPKKYHVVVWQYMGEPDGIKTYAPKWVSAWPQNPTKWGARYELSPKQKEALEFGRDTALEVAYHIRLRGGMWATIEEA